MRRAIIASTIAVLLVPLTGCSGDETQAESEKYSGQEVVENGCDEGASSVGPVVELTPGDNAPRGVSGVMDLRVSGADKCDGIYWARFIPDRKDMTKPWKVTIKTKGHAKLTQKSVPRQPGIDGFTKGVYVQPGEPVTYCVVSAGKSSCQEYGTPD